MFLKNSWIQKSIKFILSGSIAVSILSSCRKYEEGPLISFRSSARRIVGTWKITHYYVNGTDSIDLIKKQFNDTILIPYYYKDAYLRDLENALLIPVTRGGISFFYLYGYSIGKILELHLISANCVPHILNTVEPPFFLTIHIEKWHNLDFEIKKLTNKKTVWEIEMHNKKYRIEMEKVSDNGIVTSL